MRIYDRFARGMAAGTIGGIVISCVAIPLYYLTNFYATRYMDFSAVMLLSHRPHGLAENIVAWIGSIVWTGGWGAIIGYFIEVSGPKQYIIKAIFAASFLWFGFHAIATMFGKTTLTDTPATTNFINLLFAVLWGIITAKFIRYFEPHPSTDRA